MFCFPNISSLLLQFELECGSDCRRRRLVCRDLGRSCLIILWFAPSILQGFIRNKFPDLSCLIPALRSPCKLCSDPIMTTQTYIFLYSHNRHHHLRFFFSLHLNLISILTSTSLTSPNISLPSLSPSS